MIKNKDRSGWFGASDTSYIMGNWDTDTFRKWWLVKCGVTENSFHTVYTEAGNAFEHRIADTVMPYCRKDRQIKIYPLRLRVNLDAEDTYYNVEIKTVKSQVAKPKKAHEMQTQVQMFVSGLRETLLIYYELNDDDYNNFFSEIDRNRIKAFTVKFDRSFIEDEYLQRLKYLCSCLRKGVMPSEADLRKGKFNFGLQSKLFDFTASRLIRKQESR